jgi:hypothetical protein
MVGWLRINGLLSDGLLLDGFLADLPGGTVAILFTRCLDAQEQASGEVRKGAGRHHVKSGREAASLPQPGEARQSRVTARRVSSARRADHWRPREAAASSCWVS